ncbi:MAG: metal ABC transporter substrate-binding protein [Acidimicrobiales bacterium]
MLLAIAVFAVACGDEASSQPSGAAEQPYVAATTSIWADVASELSCASDLEVVSVIPLGADPHSFEPSLADRATLEDASLIVANGLGLEEAIADTLEAVEAGGGTVVHVAEVAGVEALAGDGEDGEDHEEHGEHGEDGEDEHGHDHEGGDPHIWFDPTIVLASLEPMSQVMAEMTGVDPAELERCRQSFEAELGELDAEIATTVSAIRPERKKLVTNHDSLGYYAERYGFEIVGTVIPSSSSLAQASPGELADLADAVTAEGVDVLFAEEGLSDDDIDALAQRLDGVRVVTLQTGSLGEPGTATDSYVGFMNKLTTDITSALE